MKRFVLLLSSLILLGACGKDPETPAVVAESITLSSSAIYLVQGYSQLLEYQILPADAASLEVVWNSSDPAVATVDAEGWVNAVSMGSATISVAVKDTPDVTASCTVTVGDQNAVDLGLSVLWATCNIGALAPEDYGYYYAWGETQPKDEYGIDNYKFRIPGNGDYTKYCTVITWGDIDNKTVLEPEDDVATAELGGKWRMPTKADWNELWNSTKLEWLWTKRIIENGSSIRGCQITNKTTGATLFLPYAGYKTNDALLQANQYGYYWTSELDTEYPLCAFGIDLSMDQWYTYGRYQGMPVRAVCDR